MNKTLLVVLKNSFIWYALLSLAFIFLIDKQLSSSLRARYLRQFVIKEDRPQLNDEIVYYDAFSKANPENLAAWSNLADCYYQNRQYHEVQLIYQKLKKLAQQGVAK